MKKEHPYLKGVLLHVLTLFKYNIVKITTTYGGKMNHDDVWGEEKKHTPSKETFRRWLIGEINADLRDVIKRKGR